MFDKFGLKIRLHSFVCGHKVGKKERPFNKIPDKFNCDHDVNEKPHDILKSLKNFHYNRYSTIIIVIKHCHCSDNILKEILKAIKCNILLNSKLKFIYSSYLFEDHTHADQMFPDFKGRQLKMYNRHVLRRENYRSKDYKAWRNWKNYDVRGTKPIYARNDNVPLVKDYNLVKFFNMDTIFYVQELCYPMNSCAIRSMLSVLRLLTNSPEISAEEFYQCFTEYKNRLRLFQFLQTNGNVDLYFYSMNPALVIVNNNYIFKNNKSDCDIRKGSEKDVCKLIQELKIARIPYILTEDLSRAQLLKLIDYLRKKDFKLLESFIFITMTHGTTNNIIYTHDGELNFVEDILRPLQSNPTLCNAKITFVNVHCRGELDAPDCDFDDFEKIQPTQIKQINSNTCVIYSVPDYVLSPRHPKTGTPFVEIFCKIFREISYETDIRTLYEKTWNDLKNNSYYEYLDFADKSFELVGGEDIKFRCIKPFATVPNDIILLFESLSIEIPDLFITEHSEAKEVISFHYMSSLFCIAANVNEIKFPEKLDLVREYFPNDIEAINYVEKDNGNEEED